MDFLLMSFRVQTYKFLVSMKFLNAVWLIKLEVLIIAGETVMIANEMFY